MGSVDREIGAQNREKNAITHLHSQIPGCVYEQLYYNRTDTVANGPSQRNPTRNDSFYGASPFIFIALQWV